MTEELLYDKRGDVAWVTFNRPQARNALTFAMYQGLAEICGRIATTREAKVLVINYPNNPTGGSATAASGSQA